MYVSTMKDRGVEMRLMYDCGFSVLREEVQDFAT